MKVLLPVDGSDYTKRMLAYIAARPELLGPHNVYIAFTAVTPVPTRATRFIDRGTLEDYYREQADEVLRPIGAFAAQTGWDLRTAYRAGHAVEMIVAFALEEQPDLIVMGSHGHSAFGNVILGSVTTGVLAHCGLPVLLVR